MMRLFNIYVLCAILIVPLVSCEHKELCYDHDPHALKYHVNVHRMNRNGNIPMVMLLIGKPNGLRNFL